MQYICPSLETRAAWQRQCSTLEALFYCCLTAGIAERSRKPPGAAAALLQRDAGCCGGRPHAASARCRAAARANAKGLEIAVNKGMEISDEFPQSN